MLDIENLQFRANGNTIIDGLDMHIEKGEIHGILGENGTGKSTLAYLVMGISNCQPTGGRILFEGEDITALPVPERARRGIGLAWQEPARIEGLRVSDYIKLSSKNAGLDRVRHYLQLVDMEMDQYLSRDLDSTLSGGERKRVELASVLAMQPKLAILDEPDSGIDIVSLPAILNSIVEMNGQGSSVLLITHNEKVVDIAQRVSVLCGGRVLMTGEPQEMSAWFKENCRRCPHINVPEENSPG